MTEDGSQNLIDDNSGNANCFLYCCRIVGYILLALLMLPLVLLLLVLLGSINFIYSLGFVHLCFIIISHFVTSTEFFPEVMGLCRTIFMLTLNLVFIYPSTLRCTISVCATCAFLGFLIHSCIENGWDYYWIIHIYVSVIYTIYQFWIPTSRELYEQSELDLLKHYGVKNYQISNDGRIAYIIFPNPSKPTLILVHGYGQTKVSWMETMPDLIPHFHIIAIDSPGNGGCARPRFSSTMAFKTPHDAEKYFEECFEEFRKELNLTDFILLGHSIGGYLVGTYALNHPEHVRQLILLSPYGLVPKPSEEEIAKWSSKFIYILRFAHWVKKPPQYFARLLGPLGKLGVVRGYFTRRFPSRDSQDPWVVLFGNNTYYNAALPFGYEGFFQAIIGFPVHARTCLAPRLENLKIPVAFIYGEHDWMQPKKGLEVHQKLLLKKIPSIFKAIDGASHQVYFGKPMEFISTLIDTCKELEILKNGSIDSNSISAQLHDDYAI